MRGHGAHIWMCVAMIAIPLVLVLATGNALYLLPVLACVVMMGAMVWMMMGGMGGRGGDSDRSDR